MADLVGNKSAAPPPYEKPGRWYHPAGTDASYRDYPCGCFEAAIQAYGGINTDLCKEGHGK